MKLNSEEIKGGSLARLLPFLTGANMKFTRRWFFGEFDNARKFRREISALELINSKSTGAASIFKGKLREGESSFAAALKQSRIIHRAALIAGPFRSGLFPKIKEQSALIVLLHFTGYVAEFLSSSRSN